MGCLRRLRISVWLRDQGEVLGQDSQLRLGPPSHCQGGLSSGDTDLLQIFPFNGLLIVLLNYFLSYYLWFSYILQTKSLVSF